MSPAAGQPAVRGRLHGLLAPAIARLDRELRRQQGIYEYSQSPECIFRAAIVRLDAALELEGGTIVPAGSRVIDLHLWNERIPPKDGSASLAWGRTISRRIDCSLAKLLEHIEGRPELEDVVGIRALLMFGDSEADDFLRKLAGRFGFEAIRPPKASLRDRVHQLGDNILVAMLVYAHCGELRGLSSRPGKLPLYLARPVLASHNSGMRPRR